MIPVAITPALVETLIVVVEKIIGALKKPEPTQADWDKLLADIKSLNYDDAIKRAEARAAAKSRTGTSLPPVP